MIADNFQTLLVFSSMGIPLYSCRGATQTLKPISQSANLVRDIAGELVDLSFQPFQLYQSTISCTDQRSPAVDQFWPGAIVTVDCVCELAGQGSTGGGTNGYGRTPVEGSERTEGEFTFYRPRLTMMITDYNIETPEWDGEVTWQMSLEEVGGSVTA